MFHGLRNELYTAVKTGNCDALNDLIQQLRLRCDEGRTIFQSYLLFILFSSTKNEEGHIQLHDS